MSFIEMERTIACQQMEIDDLHGKLKEAQAEIEQLTEVSPTDEKFIALGDKVVELEIQLAASQANEVQLREALEKIKDLCCKRIDPVKFKVTEQALSLPSDTTALEAIAQKAGEVMRKRCVTELKRLDYWYSANAIHVLPSVQLQDLSHSS